MRISKQQKHQNKLAILKASVELCEDQAFKDVSMKAIAQKAGISDAAIYNYFPSKEQLITGYFEERFRFAMDEAKASNEFAALNFKEQLVWLIECHLQAMESDLNFVQQVFSHLFVQPIALAKTGLGPVKKDYLEFVSEMIHKAVDRGEFDQPPFVSFLSELLWDFHIGIVYYWLNDSSEVKVNSSQVTEMGVDLLFEFLRSEVLKKGYHLLQFLFKEHIMTKLFGLGVSRGR